jgi:hypothetical protein
LEVPVPRRPTVPRLARALVAALIGVLALAPLATAAPADPGPVITDTDTPTPDTPSPTDTGQASPTPTDTPTATDTPTPSPTPEPPPTTPAAPPAPPAPPAAPPTQPAGMLAVTVTAGNAVLGPDYWTGNSAGAFVVTVKNSGTVPARTRLHYTVPAGATDAATGACQHGTCVVDALRPGASRSLTVAITVDSDAWRNAPLAGRVDFSATAPGAAAATGTVNWGVIFPPGPPAAGITLQVADVNLDTDIIMPGQLVIGLTNTGVRPAAGVIDLVLPAGVTVTQLPAECQQQEQIDPTTSECGLGTVAPGVQQAIVIPLNVTDDARADSPLAGLVRATLTPSGQNSQSTQASYQIIAPQIQSGISASRTVSPVQSPTSSGAAGSGASTATPLIILGSLLLLGLIALGLLVIRRRDPFARKRRRGRLPASARTGPWRPVATFVPPAARADSDTQSASGRPAVTPAAARHAATQAQPGEPAEPTDAAGSHEPVPAGIGEINLEWTELADSSPPPGKPVE